MIFSLAARLRGEGRGEGLYPQALKPLLDLYPLTRIASAMQSDLPRKRGEVRSHAANFNARSKSSSLSCPQKISPDGST